MIFSTYLEYTIIPSPLAAGKTQELLILATLKNTDQNQGQKVDAFEITDIKINFGTQGTGGGQLTNTAITKSNFEMGQNWSVTNDSGSTKPGMNVKLTPDPGYNTVESNAILIKVSNVSINGASGNAAIEITETGTAYYKNKAVNNPALSTGNGTIVVPKASSSKSKLLAFSASPAFVNVPGSAVTLKWSGGDAKATYTLHYLLDGSLQEVPGHIGPPAAPFSPSDHYPNPSKGDPPLELYENTNFILRIVSHSIVSFVTCTVLVSGETIYANQANIGGSTPGPETLNIYGHMSIVDSLDNGVVYIPKQGKGQFYFRTGNDNSYTDLAQINNNGDVNIDGHLTVGGSVTSTKNYITAQTLISVGGWKGSTATWSNATGASTGGATIGGMAGFSTTNGNGNYGFYELNLAEVVEGILTVDMYIANNSGGGQGIWHIISSESAFTSGKFDTTTSYQVWSTQQDPSWGQLFDQYMFRKKFTTYVKGQFIYIGAVDLGAGKLCIKMNSLSLNPLT